MLVEAPLLGIIIERVFMRRLHGASHGALFDGDARNAAHTSRSRRGVMERGDDPEPAGFLAERERPDLPRCRSPARSSSRAE